MNVERGFILLLTSLLFVATGRSKSTPSPDVLWLAHERGESVGCTREMQMIGLAARIWQSENGGVWPSGFSVLTNQLGTPAALFCPSHYRREPASTNWNNFVRDAIDYTWIAPSNLSDQPFARCRVHGFVVFGDGTIEPALTFNTASIVRPNGQMSFIVKNPANRNFDIQASTNLLDWMSLLTITNTTGPSSFTDSATNSLRRFYRARLVD